MLNADVDPLWDYSAADAFVHNNAESVRRDIVYATSLSMVYFVWHALLDGSIALKVKWKMEQLDVCRR